MASLRNIARRAIPSLQRSNFTTGHSIRAKSTAEIHGGNPDTAAEIKQEKEPKPPKTIDDSTSALDYKLQHPRSHPPPLPVFHHAQKSAEDHVLSILYNTPPPSLDPFKRHILNCLVQNEPGVLSRVSGILAARGFNIDSLVVCRTEVQDLSRMCIVLKGQDGVVEQARRQLEDLVPVWAVLDYTQTDVIQRELLLCKISTLGPEYFDLQLSSGPSLNPTPAAAPSFLPPLSQTPASKAQEALASHFLQPTNTPPQASATLHHSEALIRKANHLAAIQSLTKQFGGKTVDISETSVAIELTGKSERVDAFLSLIRPYGILEAARSGVMVMPRTPISPNPHDEEEAAYETEAMDASLLPPG